MNTHDFRRIALNLEDAQESSQMGSPDFRVAGEGAPSSGFWRVGPVTWNN